MKKISLVILLVMMLCASISADIIYSHTETVPSARTAYSAEQNNSAKKVTPTDYGCPRSIQITWFYNMAVR